jgi:hypothetical protein
MAGSADLDRSTGGYLLAGQCPIALKTQFLHACSDRRKVISRSGSGHVSSVVDVSPPVL